MPADDSRPGFVVATIRAAAAAVSALASSASSLTETNVRLDVVENAEPELGTFSSIQCGLRACEAGALVWPIDVPCPSREVWSALESACTGDVAASIPVHDGRGGRQHDGGGRWAHPAQRTKGCCAADLRDG